MRISSFLLALSVCATGQAFAQDAVPTFGAGTQAVRVDVVVLDGNGDPVADLGRDDFTLREEGQAQAIDGFEAFDLRTAPAEASAAAPAGPAPRRPGRLFLLVFDDIHLDQLSAGRAKQALSTFLDSGVRDGDQVVLATTQSGAAVGGRIPEQRAALKAALETLGGRRARVDPRGQMSTWDAYQLHVQRDKDAARAISRRYLQSGEFVEAVRNLDAPKPSPGKKFEDPLDLGGDFALVRAKAATVYVQARDQAHRALGSLERLVDGLAVQRGRKVVVLVSEGFFNDPSEDLFAPVKDAARRANAAFYFLDARGPAGLPGVMSAEMTGVVDTRDVGQAIHQEDHDADGSAALALDTGGRVIRVARLEDALDRVARESAAYYVLGYVPTNGTLDGKFRRIEVSVKRPGLQVRARRGYRALPETAPKPGELHPDLLRALDSPLPASDLPVRLQSFVLGPAASGASTLLVAEADAAAVAWRASGAIQQGRIDAGFRVQPASGGDAQDRPYVAELALAPDAYRRALQSGLPLRTELALAPGRYRARIAVRDEASGRIGSASQEFEVPAAAFRVSTPVLGEAVESDGGTARAVPIAHRSFASGSKLYCGFQVFGAKEVEGETRVSAELDVKRSDGLALASTGSRPVPKAADGSLGRVVALSLERAEPGEYELVLRVKDDVAGTVDVKREAFRVRPGAAPVAAAGASSYRDLVAAHERGETGAAAGLLALGAAAAHDGARALDCAPSCKVAAALLHTEAALLAADAGRTAEVEQHLALARALVESQSDLALQRDWLLAAGYHRQADGQVAEAERLFQEAERKGSSPEVWLALGTIAEARWSRPALAGRPPLEVAPLGSPTLTVLQARTGKDQLAREAIGLYEKALRADARQFEAQLRRGRLLAALGKKAEAEADLVAVLKSPADPYLKALARLFLGRLSEQGQEGGAAVAQYRAALSGRPSFQAAQLGLAHALRREGRLDEAAQAVRAALEPRPTGAGRAQDLEEPWISYQLGLAWRLPGALVDLRRRVQR